jgi:hypothetical protein
MDFWISNLATVSEASYLAVGLYLDSQLRVCKKSLYCVLLKAAAEDDWKEGGWTGD